MKSMVGKFAATAMGSLMALALYSGVARAQTCETALGSQDAVFYPNSTITIVKGSDVGHDALTFTGNIVNEDPVIECFQGLDPTNGCSGANEQADDFITGVPSSGTLGTMFVLNDNTACNLTPLRNGILFDIGSFTKVNNNFATFSSKSVAAETLIGGVPGPGQTVTVNAKVWRVGSSAGAPNFNYTDGTCGTFKLWFQVTNVDLQGLNLVKNPLTFNVAFGDEVENSDSQTFGCFQTTKAKICNASKYDSGNEGNCSCGTTGGDDDHAGKGW